MIPPRTPAQLLKKIEVAAEKYEACLNDIGEKNHSDCHHHELEMQDATLDLFLHLFRLVNQTQAKTQDLQNDLRRHLSESNTHTHRR